MEVSVLQNIPVQPKLYVRFVDDIFVLYDETEFSITDFLDLFNDQHPDIRLTLERESHRALPYLVITHSVQGRDGLTKRYHKARNVATSKRFLYLWV